MEYKESPKHIHGRLMEAVHITGYTMARACQELEWLIEDDRWQLGGEFEHINDFLKTIDLSEFKIAIENRKNIAKKLADLQASQRATAKALGVSHKTIDRDLESVSNDTPEEPEANEYGHEETENVSNDTPIPEPPTAITQGGDKVANDANKKAKKDEARENKKTEEIEETKQKTIYAPKIINADTYDFLDSFDNNYADLLLTDPPYSTDVKDINKFSKWVIKALHKIKPTGRAYIFAGPYPIEIKAYLNALSQSRKDFLLQNILVWTYRNTLGPSPTHIYKNNWQAIFYLTGQEAPPLNCPIMLEQFSVQDVNAPDGRIGDRYHAWQKPLDLADRFIRHSTKTEDIIIDPFAGTGTFLIAAARLDRYAFGAEIDEGMLSIAEKRGCLIEQLD